MSLPRLYTADELAERLNIAPATFRRIVRHIPGITWIQPGRKMLFEEDVAETVLKTLGDQCSIYFIRAETLGLIKIGMTKGDIGRRLIALRAMSPDKLKLLYQFRGAMAAEREIHRKIKIHHSHSEWFHPHEDVFNLMRRYGWKG